MSLLPAFRYTEAIVCRIPDTLTTTNCSNYVHGSGDGESSKSKKGKENKSKNKMNGTMNEQNLDLAKCRAELESLVTVLREIGLDVIELPPDNSCPMSSFVGDVAFVLNGMGVIMKPKSNLRQGDVNTIRTVLKKELDVDIHVIEVDEENAHVEGADILFTGRELFVGISNYTNEAGARFLANTFPEYPCSPIKVPGQYHLTHYVNMAAPDIICVGHGQDSQDVIKRMEREASFRYQTVTMPEDNASTILFVNGNLIHLSASEIPQSFKVFSEKIILPRRTVELSELSKLSANFNRLVVLLAKPKASKKLVILS